MMPISSAAGIVISGIVCVVSAMGNTGPGPSSRRRNAAAVTLAIATGTSERGLHSNSSSSTASRIAASGARNVADIPAAAPATSIVDRSASLILNSCDSSEPAAPPVMMIGPSAPNGPPLPIAIAVATGFRIVSFGATLAPPISTASIASGMPCPRIRSDPNRANSPTIIAPTIGTNTAFHPR